MPRSPEAQLKFLVERANAKWATKEEPKVANNALKDTKFNGGSNERKNRFKNDLFEDL